MNEYSPMNEVPLSRCIAGICDEGKTVDECLDWFPEEQDNLRPLLELTQRLQNAKGLEAPADFRLTARARLESLLEQEEEPAVQIASVPASFRPAQRPAIPPRTLDRRPVWSFAIGLAIVLLLLVVNSTATLASRALPGDALFPVKTASEDVLLFFASSPRADAELHLQYTDRRLAEVKALATAGKTQRLGQAIDLYKEEVASTAGYVLKNQSSIEEDAQVVEDIADKVASHEERLTTLAEQWPASQPALTEQEAATIRQDLFAMRDVLRDLYSALHKDVDVPGLEPLLPTLPAVITQIAPSTDWLTATPTPYEKPEQFSPTWYPCHPEGNCWTTEQQPTAMPEYQPGFWSPWAITPSPDGEEIPEIPVYMETMIPRYWPTFQPTYYPNEDPEGTDDEENFFPPDFPEEPGSDEEWFPQEPGDDENPWEEMEEMEEAFPDDAPGDDFPGGWLP